MVGMRLENQHTVPHAEPQKGRQVLRADEDYSKEVQKSLPIRKGHVERMRESADDESGQFEGEQ